MDNNKGSKYQAQDSGAYEDQASTIGWHGHEILFGLMYEYINRGETLLDIGIGTGMSSDLFHKAGLQISGFDNSDEMLAGCKSKGFSGKIIQHDLTDIPYPYEAHSFQHIISLAVLNFQPELEPVIREASRMIAPQGVFAFTVEEQKPNQETQYTIHVEDQSAPFDVSMFRHSDQDVRAILENNGFRVCKDFEFLADKYPDQGIEVYLKIYVARKDSIAV